MILTKKNLDEINSALEYFEREFGRTLDHVNFIVSSDYEGKKLSDEPWNIEFKTSTIKKNRYGVTIIDINHP